MTRKKFELAQDTKPPSSPSETYPPSATLKIKEPSPPPTYISEASPPSASLKIKEPSSPPTYISEAPLSPRNHTEQSAIPLIEAQSGPKQPTGRLHKSGSFKPTEREKTSDIHIPTYNPSTSKETSGQLHGSKPHGETVSRLYPKLPELSNNKNTTSHSRLGSPRKVPKRYNSVTSDESVPRIVVKRPSKKDVRRRKTSGRDVDVHQTERKIMDVEGERLASIYGGLSTEPAGGSSLASFHRAMASKNYGRNSGGDGGFTNFAYVQDADDEDDVIDSFEDDANCNSTDVTPSEQSSASRRMSFEEPAHIPNGNVFGREPKVDFRSLKEKKSPPKSIKTKEKRHWDRFTTTGKETMSSGDKLFWDKVFVVTKIIVAIVLFILTLATAVISKICFIIISANMLPPSGDSKKGTAAFDSLKTGNFSLQYYADGNSKKMETNVLWIWAMITMIGSPYFFTFCRNFWRIWIQFGSRGSSSVSVILLVLLIESLHTLGLIITVFVLVPSLDPVSGLLFTLCLAVVPGFLKVVYPTVKKAELQQNNVTMTRYHAGNVVNLIGALGQLVTLAAWCYNVYLHFDEKFDHIGFFACLILAPILASIHWWENFVHEGEKESSGLPLLARHIRQCRTQLTFYASIWKMALIIVIPMALYGAPCDSGSDCVNVFFFKKERSDLKSHLLTTTTVVNDQNDNIFGHCNHYLPIIIAAIGVLNSGICFKLGKIGCKIMTQVTDFSLPLILSTPATLGIIILMHGGFITDYGFQTLTSAELQNRDATCKLPFPQWNSKTGEMFTGLTEDYRMWGILVAAFVVGLGSFLIVTNYIWYPGKERLLRTDKLFVQPLYSGVATDISLMLNRRRIEKVKTSDARKTKVKEQTLFEGVEDVDLEDKSVFTGKDTPLIYMCATMWHETENEMTQLLKSVFRMDEDQCTRKNTQFLLNRKDPDYYEFEAHIFFDDAFEKHNDDQYDFTVNQYVKLLVKTVQFSARAVIGANYKLSNPVKVGTPYGGRLVWTLPGGNKLIAHLKDKTVIRHRKRWSQVMYMYYFLAHQLFKDEKKSRKAILRNAKNTYLLALDGDVDFHPNAVQLLVDRMKKNTDVGAACGRIHPIGNGAMVWYQKFEYAVSHWLQKAAEDKLGCVLCSPGCFSLFRGAALMDDNVMHRYTTPPSEPRHHVQYDQGEDRWLCTLLLQQGHRVEYCAASDALTFAPEGFYEFFKQRRRWMPSTMANIIDLLTDWKNVTSKNPEISLLYVMYQGLLMVSSILTPGTIFLMILGAINMAYPKIDLWWALIVNIIPIAVMIALCFVANDQKQLTYAAILSTLYSLIMMVVIVGLLVGAAESGLCSVTTVFISFVAGVFVLAAFVHPQEFWCLIHGFLYFLAIPSMSMILMIYSLGNLHVVTWGTRENVSVADKAQDKKKKKAGFLNKLGHYLPWGTSGGNNPEDDNLRAVLDRLDGIEDQITRMSTNNTSLSGGIGSHRGLSDPHYSDRNFLINRSVGAYVAGQGNGEVPFSQSLDVIAGAGERENPMYTADKPETRDQLHNAFWMTEDESFKSMKKLTLEQDEVKFWEELIDEYLKPLEADKNQQAQMAADLIELRNKVCLIFILINSLFIIIVFTLQKVVSEGSISVMLPCASKNPTPEQRSRQSIEPISVAFTVVFGLLLFLQFLCMLLHRMATLLHICASTEIFKKKTKMLKNLGMAQPDVEEAEEAVQAQAEYSYEQVYEMVRDMQKDQDADSMSMTSESSYGESEVDDEEFSIRKKEDAKSRWKRIATKKPKVTDKNMHTNFVNNVQAFHSMLERDKDLKDLKAEENEDEEKYVQRFKKQTKFNRFRNASVHVMTQLANDKSMRDGQLQRIKKLNERQEELKKRKAAIGFKDAAIKVMPNLRNKFGNIARRAMMQKESEQIKSEELEIEMEKLDENLDAELAGMGDDTPVKEIFNSTGFYDDNDGVGTLQTGARGSGLDTNVRNSQISSLGADGGRSSDNTGRSLTDEEFQIHIPKPDSDDEWPEEDDYVNKQDTDDTHARL